MAFGVGLAVLAQLHGTASAAPASVTLPGNRTFPESITSTADGTLYVGSFAEGGVLRVRPGASQAEPWIEPGAFDSRSVLGVLADERSGTLWVCSNDLSARGIPGPGSAKGSALIGFDLKTGAGKLRAPFAGDHTFCNDAAIGPDGAVYVTNTAAPQILKLRPGGTQLEIWSTDLLFQPPAQGGGLDGIAFGSDGNLYVDTFTPGEFFRVEVKDGTAGKVTKLQTSRQLVLADALRPLGGNRFLTIEGGGRLDQVTVTGDTASIETLRDGFGRPTGVTQVGQSAWVAEGQLDHVADPAGKGPTLPFRVYEVPLLGH
ncbi:MAG TPA: hypothetical protein VM689_25720 [Aliidongia sp.]|nr:hypothetical protein [Aliidongia sp.]